ncbi:MAG: hypothetical protein IIU65_04320 [Clostridia bacterium]|nr:hypothetical protein [Clostridia bacterium]
MYVCPNCGKEFEKETFFCGECGTQTVVKEAVVENAAPTVAEKKEPFIVTLFSFISNTVNALSAFFYAISFAMIRVYCNLESGYYSYYISENVSFDECWFVPGNIFAVLGIGVAIVAFIFSLIKKADTKTKFSRITGLLVSVLLLIVGITIASA